MVSAEASGIYLSVIIPAYNEERRLPPTLRDVLRYLTSQSYSWEVVVVNDGSADRTADVVRAAVVADARVRLLQYGGNRGKGYAVRYGMQHTSGQFRLFMDADNSTTVDHVEQLWPYFSLGFEVVIGSRDAPGAQIVVHQPWWKEQLGNLGNWWIQFWAVPGIRDTQAGFKMFSARAAEEVFERLTLDRWGFDVEALAVARHRGLPIAERPIRWVNDPNTTVSPRAYFEVLREVVQVRLNLWRGVYGKKARRGKARRG